MIPVDYALLAQRSYFDPPTVGFQNSSARMHVYGNVHMFRGTNNIMSMVADADIIEDNVWGLGKIHQGFYQSMSLILPACLALPRPTAVGGHSLGAAMAIIYAAILAMNGTVVSVYAFEPPRLCGDDGITMKTLFTDKKVPFYATRNGNDIVTQVPLGFTLPGALTPIGKPLFPFNNIADHNISRVVSALAAKS